MSDTELLELMARLQIDLLWHELYVEALGDRSVYDTPAAIELLGDDPAAAARRAIQRCAALIEETQSDE